MVEEEYEAKTTPSKKILYIEDLEIELKPDIDDYIIESAVEHLAEISATPLAFKVATEADIEVKVKRGKRK